MSIKYIFKRKPPPVRHVFVLKGQIVDGRFIVDTMFDDGREPPLSTCLLEFK